MATPTVSISDVILSVLRNAADDAGKVPITLLERVFTEIQLGQNASAMRQELEDIAGKLAEAEDETRSLLGDEQQSETFSNAALELDAAIAHTEEAANTIMDAAEAAMAMTQDAAIQEKLMEVITACNFQDLSGQRIRKVAKVITFIEPKVKRLIALLTESETLPRKLAKDHGTTSKDGILKDDKHLMNGPQLPGHGTSQADIDALFNNG